MSDCETERVVGVAPWLPPPLSRSAWWTKPVRAERLAALRIGLAAVLLIDILTTYLPHIEDLFVPGSLGGAAVFPGVFQGGSWNWSLFAWVQSSTLVWWSLAAWIVASGMLLVGLASRFAAALAWVIAVSFFCINPYVVNAGDAVRIIILCFLMCSPCGAVWSVDSWLRKTVEARKNARSKTQSIVPISHSATFIHPWPLRLLFLQLVFIYFCNGLHKNIPGSDWWTGETVYAILANLAMCRFPYNRVPIPYFVTKLLTWTVFLFELGFPLWVALPRTRVWALCLGAAFHIGLAVFMELIMFPAYMLCLYLPLVPWERVADRWWSENCSKQS